MCRATYRTHARRAPGAAAGPARRDVKDRGRRRDAGANQWRSIAPPGPWGLVPTGRRPIVQGGPPCAGPCPTTSRASGGSRHRVPGATSGRPRATPEAPPPNAPQRKVDRGAIHEDEGTDDRGTAGPPSLLRLPALARQGLPPLAA